MKPKINKSVQFRNSIYSVNVSQDLDDDKVLEMIIEKIVSSQTESVRKDLMNIVSNLELEIARYKWIIKNMSNEKLKKWYHFF